MILRFYDFSCARCLHLKSLSKDCSVIAGLTDEFLSFVRMHEQSYVILATPTTNEHFIRLLGLTGLSAFRRSAVEFVTMVR